MLENDEDTYQPMKTEMTETELIQGLISPLISLTLKLNEPNVCLILYGILDKNCLLHIYILPTQYKYIICSLIIEIRHLECGSSVVPKIIYDHTYTNHSHLS